MSSLTISEVVEFDHSPLTEEFVKQTLIDSLKRDFDNVKIVNKDGEELISGRIKTKLMNPIVSIKGPLKIQIKEQKAKILIDGDTKTNGWFWATFIIAFLLLFAGGSGVVLYAVMIFMHFSQKKKSGEAFQSAFNRIKFESEGL